MPRSEIDDIFASSSKKPKSRQQQQAPKPAIEVPKKKKKSNKKRKHEPAEPTEPTPDPPVKRQRVPETVFDPSQGLAASSKRKQPVAASEPSKKKKKTTRDDELRFKDSRGTGPRRTTEEGFLVFKEDELGITDQGGDTPLCPFDCQCCF